MTSAAIKVTVYFVGLIHFYNIENASQRKVYALKTSEGVVHEGVALMAHHPHVEIAGEGLQGGKATCTANGATWNGVACVVKNLPDKTAITLPESTTAFQVMTERFNLVPTLAGQCPGSTLKAAALTDYAATLTPTSGKLDLCTYKGGLVTYLALDNATGDLVINDKRFPLINGARVYISNSPMVPHSGGDPNPGEHFYWFYTILTPPTGGACKKVPKVRFFGPECTRFAPTHKDSFPALSGTEFCGPIRNPPQQ